MPTYNNDTIYRVKLKRIVERGPMKFRPGSEIEMKGSFLMAIIHEHGEEVIDYALANT